MSRQNKFPNLEFRWVDGAWYDVSVRLVGSCLHVHYRGFSKAYDEIWVPEYFETGEEVRSKFRLSSEQLQDEQCSQVKVGICICASCSSDGRDIRFFDAVVEEVYRSRHHFVDGEEQCTCKFQVVWLAGPYAYQRSCVSVENICLLKAGRYIETHSVLKSFVTLVDNMVKPEAGERASEWSRTRKRTYTRAIDTINLNDKEVKPQLTDTANERDKRNHLRRKITDTKRSATELAVTDNEQKSESLGSDSVKGSEIPSCWYSQRKNRDIVLKDGEFKRITKLHGDISTDGCKKDTISPYPYSGNTNFEHEDIQKDRRIEVFTNAEKIITECNIKETDSSIQRKEEKPNLSNLKCLPIRVGILPKDSSKETLDDAEKIMTGCNLEGTNFNRERKEGKHSLLDLNSLPVKLEDSVEIIENVKVGNNRLEAEQDDSVENVENVKALNGCLEAKQEWLS